MRNYLFTVVYTVIVACTAYGQENYAVSAIPRALTDRAAAVIRNNEMTVVVNSPDDVTYRGKVAVTILNSAGDDHARVVIFYDKLHRVGTLRGMIFNEFGLPSGKFAEKDFRDMSAVNDGTLYQDDRVKVYSPAQISYPYTIVYEYEMRVRQSLMFPSWRPVRYAGVGLEKSSLVFSCPASFNLRYKELNYPGKAQETQEKNTKTYRWEIRHIQPLRSEPYSPDPESYLPSVKLAPENFAWKGIKGSFTDWNEFGKWMNSNLLQGRDVLPPATIAYIKEMVQDLPDDRAKAKKLYEYMQQKTRYISVQVGIGGFQPYPASDVDRLGYGDCKGLVNYMQALLKVAGVGSYYCIVNSGSFRKDISPDFASIEDGDHIILCLPFKNDTTWLECTNKKIPFGFLGDFTDDRQVLACTPEGGRLMHTPKFSYSENRQLRKASFGLSDNGDLKGSVITHFEGCQYDNHDVLEDEPFSEQVKYLARMYPLPNLDIQAFEFKKEKSARPLTSETMRITSRGYASLNNDRYYLSLNVINKGRVVPDTRNRQNPLYINRGYTDEDEYIFEIPETLKAEYTPQNRTIEKPFGTYSATIVVDGNKVTWQRKLQIKEGTYPAEQYAEFVKFWQSVAEADNARLVLM